jgi:hypothetical protein
MISKLQDWFATRCDGDWEHQGGITIQTTDNPRWFEKIEFDDLDHSVSKEIESKSIERSESDFLTFRYCDADHILTIACGVSNLGEALTVFLDLDAACEGKG